MYKISKSFTVLFAFSFIALKLTAGGIITTVAGGDLQPDFVNAATASLVFPSSVAVDNQDNVYIVDIYSGKIKKLHPNGNLTDLGVLNSNGPDISNFKEPGAVVADALGNIYFSDPKNGLIKKRDSLGNITLVAGDGGTANKQYLGPISATGVSLVRPIGLALDQSGNLYIADKGNSSVRRLQLNADLISTTAGSAGTPDGPDPKTSGYSGDGGPAIDAGLRNPHGVAVDSVRNVVYIADTFNHLIRKVDSQGVITTVAGSLRAVDNGDGTFDTNEDSGYSGDGGPAISAKLDNPRGVAVDSAGNLYIADTNNYVIRKVDTNGVITTVAGAGVPGYSGDGGEATIAKLDSPYAVACDSAGNLYIADTGNTRVRKVTFATTNVDTTFTTLAGTAGGEGSADGTGSAALFKYPNGVAVDATGNVYIADEGNHTIRKITSGGVVTTLAGTAGSSGSTDGTGSAARFASPAGVAADVEGNVYVADRANHAIRKITSGGVVTTLAGSTAGSTGSSDGAGTSAQFWSPRSVAVDDRGTLYVADTANHTIRMITSGGEVSTLAGTAGSLGSTDGTGSAARFNQPRGVAVDAVGNVYVADWVNHTIRKINPDGVVTTLAGTAGSSGSTDGTGSAARFNRPLGVAVDAAGNVYVTDGSNHTIRKITSGGVVTTLGGTAGSTGSTDGIGSAAQFDSPAGVAVDAAGNLYVADQSNHTIRKSSLQPLVTTPTSANLAATTATLGGNVISDTGYGVTARGVVYAVTATNATPQLDGTGVINVAGTGTTGEFTVNVTGLTAGTAYSYAAYATNLAGTAYTSVGTFTTPPLAVPGAPTGVAAVRGAGEAVVSFTAPLSNGGAAIMSYTVTASPSGLTATGTSSPITITGLTNGTSYTFTVTATNSVGAGSASSASSAITPTAGSLAGVTFSNTGSGSTAEAKATAVDAAGNIYLTGYFSYGDATSFSIGGVTLPKIGTRDAWVAKLDSTRTVVWAKNFGGSGASTQGYGIAVDTAGNVYLAGDFGRANLTTPALTIVGEYDAFALKLDSSGTTIWARNFGGSGAYVTGSGIAVDPIGNVYLGGNFSDGNLTTLALTMLGRRDAFAIKLDGSGTTTWAKNYGGSGARAWGLSIAVDGSGNVYLGGRFQSANLTTPALTKLGTLDAFALKLDSSGATTWARNYGGSGASAAGNGIAVDTIGNVYLGGSFDQSLTTPALTKLGTQDAFALKLDSSGATTWAKNFGGSGARAAGASIAVDGSGNIYLGGYFDQSSLTTPALTRIGTLDGFALKLDNSGTTTWAKNYGGSGASAYLGSIAADRSGNVFLGGYFSAANLTTPALTLSSSFSPFLIAAYLPEPAVPGAPTGISAVSGNAQATVSFTAPASTGSAAITGYTVTSNPAGGTDSNAGSTSLSHVITGLTNGTSYTFTVTATNSVGTGSASSASSAVTPVGTPTITTPTSASIGSTTATLGGNVTATGGASLTAVGVVYAVTSANSNPQLSGTGVTNLAGTAATGVFTVNATGLTAGTAYSYAAYATNSVGTTYTSVGTFTTTVPTPTLTFTTPSTASVAVGATRTNAVTSTLSGGSYGAITYTSSDTGKATVNATTGVVTGVAVGSTTITATQAAAAGFNATTSTSYTLTVTIGTPTISAAPSASSIIYGQTLASSALSGGTASVPGTFAFTTPSTAPGVGTAAQGVTFTPTDPTNYTSMTTTVNVTVVKATPAITVAPTASGITYGQTLAASTLSGGTASTAGTFTFTTVSTAPNAGTSAQGVTFTPSSTALFNTTTTTVNVTVAKATPTITWATPSAINYGTALSATQLNATGSVAGTIAYSPASGTTPSAGTQTLTATFTPTDTANYNTATRTVSLVVGKATPTITWATPSAITYGTALSATQLNATGSVAGTIAYSPASGATPSAGTQTLTATFTPTDTANYNPATGTVSLTVNKATPTITWATPSAITFGTALSATQLNATGSVAGTIAYSPTSGTTPSVGTQTLTATFTPTDTANYNPATGTVSLTVNKATPTITWATPSAITFGASLSATQLNATGSVAGTIAYSPASGTTPSAGTQTLTATFTPTDTANYNTATRTVSLVVGKATPTITWATPSAITYGTALSATQLNATGSVAGTIAYSPASGATPSAGTQTLTATFTPTDTANYNPATGTVSLTVNKATPTITWATPSAITFGTALSATQLNATGSVAGTIAYSPASGTTPSAGTQTLTATFTPTDTANYNPATGTVSLTVNKATPTITWATPSAITFGTALSATQLNATASVAGAFVYSPASGSIPSVGTQTLSATFTPTDTANYNPASASVALSVAVAVPGSPTSISATTANGEATVTFTAPINPGSSAITGYTIRATASDGSTVTVNATGSPAKVTGLTPGKSYRFTVTANNSAGSSDTGTTSDGLTISLVNQTISFTAPADRTSNSGSFTLAATATSGLPVTFTVVSGPALLTGNVLDLTGAAGTVKIRASQAGNATYAAAPAVEVSFAVTAGSAQVVLSSVVNPSTQKSEGTLGVVLTGNSRTGVLLLVSSGSGPSGTAEFTLGAGGSFTASFESSSTPSGLPLERGVQAASVTYTFTGTFVNNVLTGSIQPLGYGFKAEAPVNPPASATSVGLYTSAALSADSGTVYSLVGSNNEVLVLVKTPTVTTGGLTTLKADGSYTLAATTTSGSVTLSGGVNPTTTTTTATLTLPGNTKVDFSGLSTTTKRTDRLIGLASRAKVGTGESVLITGVAIGGTDSKRVLIRAGGPALAAFGLASTLPNPTIKIYRGSTLIAQNDDWNPADAAEMGRLGLFAFPNGSKDAAILTTLAPGGYTAHISDQSGTGTGVALAEIYDASVNPAAEEQRLISIASRGTVTPGDGALIGGFVVTGNSPKTLLIRGIGPALTAFGVAGALADPSLTIYQDSKVITTNEGWANSAAIAAAAIQTGAFALSSTSKDAAVLLTLSPGAYSAQIKSANNASSGVALIEIYEVP
jgi:hypothetical protein